jgi:hypothetical protein
MRKGFEKHRHLVLAQQLRGRWDSTIRPHLQYYANQDSKLPASIAAALIPAFGSA